MALHAVDLQPEPNIAASSGGGGGNTIDGRLSRLETRVEYLATKEDIQKLKVWVLAGVLGGTMLAAGLALGVLKLFP